MSEVQDKRLTVVIGCDCDPDRPQYGGPRYDSRAPLAWRGIAHGVTRAAQICADAGGRFGPLKVTWCVRSDLQLRETHGDCAWSYRRFEDVWRDLAQSGHEIGWHPHLWRWSDVHGCWYQEVQDAAWIEECLEAGFAGLAEASGAPPRSMRAGWNFHNNVTMRKASELGIKIDFSGVPGQRWHGGPHSHGTVLCEKTDWSVTTEQPYFTSDADYRRPPQPGEQPLPVLEVPVSSFLSRSLSLTWVIRSAFKAGQGHRIRSLYNGLRSDSRCVSPSLAAHPRVVLPLINRKLAEAEGNGEALLVACFHADELLKANGWTRIIFGASNFARNLRALVQGATARGVHVESLTAAQLLTALAAGRSEDAGQPRTGDASGRHPRVDRGSPK